MNARQQALAQRRQLLQLRSSLLRQDLTLQCEQLRQRTRPATQVIDWVQGLLRRPVWATAAGALFLSLRPLRAIKWASRGALAVSLLRQVLAVVAAMRR
jgi:hypothetical protein